MFPLHWCAESIKLTSFKNHAVIGYFVPGLHAGAVPAMPPELVLALVDGDLDSLDGRCRHIWVPHAYLQLAPREAGQCQAHCVGVQDGFNIGDFQAQYLIGVCPAWRKRQRIHDYRDLTLLFNWCRAHSKVQIINFSVEIVQV